VIQKLEDYGILDDTYIFYSSDKGYHIGQHRLPPDKGYGFGEDINVPLIVRGPGVPSGKKVTFATNHVDPAPTFFDIMSMPWREDYDGVPVPLTEEGICALEESGKAAEHVQIEFWMLKNPSEYNIEGETNNTYKGVRIVGEGYGWYYSVWCRGSHELYDMPVRISSTGWDVLTNGCVEGSVTDEQPSLHKCHLQYPNGKHHIPPHRPTDSSDPCAQDLQR
jgi:hypothetical protein